MNEGEAYNSRLLEVIAENLVVGNFEILKSMAGQVGMPRSISESILTITQLLEQTHSQSSIYQIDVFFYSDFIKDVQSGEITESTIRNREDVSPQKQEQAIKLLRKIKSSEQSRIRAQQELKMRNEQLEDLVRQSKIRDNALQRHIETLLIKLTEKNNLLGQYHIKIKEQQVEISALKQRQAEITSELSQMSLFRQKFDEIKQQFKKQEKKSMILGSQLKQKLSFIQSCISQKQEIQGQLIKKEEENLILKLEMDTLKDQLEKSRVVKKRSSKEIFIDTNSIIQQFQMNQQVAANFQQKINGIIGQVTSMSSLYNYSLHKGENFHRRVDNKKNILLLCKTVDNRIIGGFTSNGFSLKAQQKQAKAFLFSFYDEEMKVFPLKRGKASTTYDNDYIIFGNEELCIQKGSDQLTSYFVNGSQNILHYHFDESEDRQTFFSIKESGTNVVKLLNYEMIELKIKIQNDEARLV